MLIGTAIFAGIGLLAVGAVIGLVLLAAGAMVHFLVRALRGLPVTRPAPTPAAGAVIDGEYRVVATRHDNPGSLPHAS